MYWKRATFLVSFAIVLLGFVSYATYSLYTENMQLRKELNELQKEVLKLQAEIKRASKKAVETPENSETARTEEAEDGKNLEQEIERQLCFVKKAENVGSEFLLSVDYVQFLTGDAAKKEAIRRGWDPDIEYCIVNDNSKIRTFRVARELVNGKVKLVSKSGGVVPEGYEISFGEWFDIYNGMGEEEFCNAVRDAAYWIWIKNEEVVRLEQHYFP